MHAAINQSGSTRISPLMVTVAASAVIAGLIGIGTLTGMLSGKRSPARNEEPMVRVEPKPAASSVCAVCGTIESIRTVEVLDEANPTVGAPESKSGTDSGAAVSNQATSVLDTLSSAFTATEAARNARKRYAYRVTLRMDDGSFRAISQSSPPSFAVGDKVRVVEGRLVRS